MYIIINDELSSEITDTEYKDRSTTKELRLLGPISSSNIFVGRNNSGKSRMLRGVLKAKRVTTVSVSDFHGRVGSLENISPVMFNNYVTAIINVRYNAGLDVTKLLNESHHYLWEKSKLNKVELEVSVDPRYVGRLISTVKEYTSSNQLKSLYEILEIEYNKLDLLKYIVENITTSPVSVRQEITNALNAKLLAFSKNYNPSDITAIVASTEKIMSVIKNFLEVSIIEWSIPSRVYFPVLRSISTLYDNGKRINRDFFKESILKNYNISAELMEELSLEVESGLSLYSEIRKARNSERSIRKRFEAFERFLSNCFFDGEVVDIVAKDDGSDVDKNIIINIGDDEKRIHDLGDGIQALILIMFKLYMSERESWVFIEEPEINIHPGLQRLMMKHIVENKFIREKKLKIFMTTHSNHIIDFNSEVKQGCSIFSFNKDENDNTHYVESKSTPDSSMMKLLGVQNSSVLLANSTIWVEGPTDRKILDVLLGLYCKENSFKKPNEGLDYSYVEYAGSNLVHYLFEGEEELPDKIIAKFISNKILVIADRDSGKDEKHAAYLSKESDLFKYLVLPVREIENLVSSKHLKKLLTDVFNVDSSVAEDASINSSHYLSSYLGEYIIKTLGEDVSKSIAADSGTLSTYYKNKFADKFAETAKWDLLHKEAQILGESLYRFVKS